MKRLHRAICAAIVAGAPAWAALAQPVEPAPPTLAGPMVWTEEEFERIGSLLAGSWRSTSPVDLFPGQEGEPTDIIVSVAPVKLSQLPDAMYMEISRADSSGRPYRQVLTQLYRRQGAIRMRTLEIRNQNTDTSNLLVGMWAAPEHMPDLPRDLFIATLDLELTASGDGYVGKTPYPYPTATGGAVEMTSEVAFTPDSLVTIDRGYDASGAVVWGSAESGKYTYTRCESPMAATKGEDGFVAIHLRDAGEGAPIADGASVAMHYTGWLSNGRMFETSRRQGGRTASYVAPGELIEGWRKGAEGMRKGDWRKIIVPPALGYGASTALGGVIPSNATLIFEIECMFVTPAEGAPPAGTGGDGQ